MYNIRVTFIEIQKGDGYAQFRMNFGYQKLCTTYYTVKTRTITLNITYLSSRTNPAGDTMRRSRNTQLTTRESGQGAVCEITRTVHFLALNFCVCAIYVYPNVVLDLQINRASIMCLAKVESGVRSMNGYSGQIPRKPLQFTSISSDH